MAPRNGHLLDSCWTPLPDLTVAAGQRRPSLIPWSRQQILTIKKAATHERLGHRVPLEMFLSAKLVSSGTNWCPKLQYNLKKSSNVS